MLRNILAIALGVMLSFLLLVASGYLVYHIQLSTGWSEPRLGSLVRYVIDPLIAIIAGSLVGALARSRAGVLAALSLIPWVLVPLFYRRLSALHEATLIFLSCFYLLLGAGVAQFVFRIRARTKPVS